MKIAYIHGFASSSQSQTVNIIKKYFPEDEIFAYDIPVAPHEAITFLRERIDVDDIDVAIGSSLGAYYLLHTSGCAKFAINPPFNPNIILEKYIGKEMHYLTPRKDGVQKFLWSAEYSHQIDYYNKKLSEVDIEILDESVLYFSNNDEVVSDNNSFKDYWSKVPMEGAHRFTEEMFVKYLLLPLLEFKEYFDNRRSTSHDSL